MLCSLLPGVGFVQYDSTMTYLLPTHAYHLATWLIDDIAKFFTVLHSA